MCFYAEVEGFEPPVQLLTQRFSRPPRSTALAHLLQWAVVLPLIIPYINDIFCLKKEKLALRTKHNPNNNEINRFSIRVRKN